MVKELFTALAVVSVASMSAAGQTPANAPARAATSAPPSKPYAPPRTPWGDPDIQGNYTNKYE